jgi:Thioredoxin
VAPIFKQLAEEMPSVKFVKVDTDKDEDAVEQFNIQGLPLFAMFVDGKIVSTQNRQVSLRTSAPLPSHQINHPFVPRFTRSVIPNVQVASHSGALSKDNLKKFIDNAVSKK